jgi:hypothetical protein
MMMTAAPATVLKPALIRAISLGIRDMKCFPQ